MPLAWVFFASSLETLAKDEKYLALLLSERRDKLRERKDKLTLREMEAITQDVNHPCHHLVPIAQKHDYSTRTKERGSNVGRIISRTERHKSSFMPRAVKLFNNKL